MRRITSIGHEKTIQPTSFSPLYWNFYRLIIANSYCDYKECYLFIQLISVCLHEISFRTKWIIFILVSGQFLITVYMIQPEMKLIARVISMRSFWQRWNFISGDKISCKHYPEWNYIKDKKKHLCMGLFHQRKNDWLLLNGSFFSYHPWSKISIQSTGNEK